MANRDHGFLILFLLICLLGLWIHFGFKSINDGWEYPLKNNVIPHYTRIFKEFNECVEKNEQRIVALNLMIDALVDNQGHLLCQDAGRLGKTSEACRDVRDVR